MNRELMGPALVDSFRRMTPRYQWRNPVMFVVYIGSILTTILWVQSLFGQGEAPSGFILAITLWLWATLVFANFAEAIAEGRSKAQAASLKSARKDTIAKKLARAERDAPSTPTRLAPAAPRRSRPGRAGRPRAGRRRGRRRRGGDQRKRGDRRKRAGDPRRGQRLQHGHRRHRRAVRLDHRAHQRQSGRGLPRPHDRHGRGRLASEDAERDRAHDPARRDDPRVPARHRDAAAVFDLQRRSGEGGHAGVDHGAGRAARLPHPDHDRRASVGDRRRRHGPHDARQRDRHLRPRGRGCRRLRRAASRQDRHHHLRQSAGRRRCTRYPA